MLHVATYFVDSNLAGGVDDNALTVGETTARLCLNWQMPKQLILSLVFQANSGLSASDNITLSNFITAQADSKKRCGRLCLS